MNIDAKKKILLAMIFISALVVLLWFPALRLFVSKHPGLIAVLVGVSGEVYFDWKEEHGRNARWKKFFMALLVFGLTYELYEASATDEEAANAIKLAGQANERAANTESNNLILRSNVLALELQFMQTSNNVAAILPRHLTHDQMDVLSLFLRQKNMHSAKILLRMPPQNLDKEANEFGDDLIGALSMGGVRPEIEYENPREGEGLSIVYPGCPFSPPPPVVEVLKSGFKLANIDFDTWGLSISSNMVEIVVGEQKRLTDKPTEYAIMIFRGDGFLRAGGAAAFIANDGIHVSRPEDGRIKVRLDFNRTFLYPPNLEVKGGDIAIGEHGQGMSWTFDLKSPPQTTTNLNDLNFKLETIP